MWVVFLFKRVILKIDQLGGDSPRRFWCHVVTREGPRSSPNYHHHPSWCHFRARKRPLWPKRSKLVARPLIRGWVSRVRYLHRTRPSRGQ